MNNKAEEYLKKYNIPNIKWTAYVNSKDEVKEGMDFPYSTAEVIESYHQSRVKAISDEAKKYIKNIRYFKGDKTLERKVYHIEEEDFNKLIKQ